MKSIVSRSLRAFNRKHPEIKSAKKFYKGWYDYLESAAGHLNTPATAAGRKTRKYIFAVLYEAITKKKAIFVYIRRNYFSNRFTRE